MVEAEHTEFEVKFIVPPTARVKVLAEVARGAGFQGRQTHAALYLDTPDARLAAAGLAWRVRREGRRWVQTLKAGGLGGLERFEHAVPRPDATPDASLHADAPAGRHLQALARQARDEGHPVDVRFHTEVRRSTRVLRTRGAVVALSFDEGHIVAGDLRRRVLELEFECVSGPRSAMLDLARRWQQRFGLWLDPFSKAERGGLLAAGKLHPPVRKAAPVRYDAGAPAGLAFGAVLDECLDQVLRNAACLCDGDPAQRVEHVHQLRVGLRRLRSALRTFRAWVQPPPPALEQGLRELFSALGATRDADVMDTGVAAALAAVGAPPLPARHDARAADPVQLARAASTQRLLLDWLSWRAVGFDPQAVPPPSTHSEAAPRLAEAARALSVLAPPGAARKTSTKAPRPLKRLASKRLQAWHERLAQLVRDFDALDEPALHGLRKRIKRQRYAVEFLAPLLRKRGQARYLKLLAQAQERMGVLNDLFVARAHYQQRVDTEPAAWFALGWLAARIAEASAAGRPTLQALSGAQPPRP